MASEDEIKAKAAELEQQGQTLRSRRMTTIDDPTMRSIQELAAGHGDPEIAKKFPGWHEGDFKRLLAIMSADLGEAVRHELVSLIEDGHPLDKAIARVKKHPKSVKAWAHLHKTATAHEKHVHVKHKGKKKKVEKVYVYPYPYLGFFGGGFARIGGEDGREAAHSIGLGGGLVGHGDGDSAGDHGGGSGGVVGGSLGGGVGGSAGGGVAGGGGGAGGAGGGGAGGGGGGGGG